MSFLRKRLWNAVVIILAIAHYTSAESRSYVAILGDPHDLTVWAIRIAVVDAATEEPLAKARLTLRDISLRSNVVDITTDRTGVAIILVKEERYIPAIGTLRVSLRDYEAWESQIEQWSLVEAEDDLPLYIPGQIGDWSGSLRPSDDEIIRALRTGKYEIWDDDNVNYVGIGCFEFHAQLQRVVEESGIGTDRHPFGRTRMGREHRHVYDCRHSTELLSRWKGFVKVNSEQGEIINLEVEFTCRDGHLECSVREFNEDGAIQRSFHSSDIIVGGGTIEFSSGEGGMCYFRYEHDGDSLSGTVDCTWSEELETRLYRR